MSRRAVWQFAYRLFFSIETASAGYLAREADKKGKAMKNSLCPHSETINRIDQCALARSAKMPSQRATCFKTCSGAVPPT